MDKIMKKIYLILIISSIALAGYAVTASANIANDLVVIKHKDGYNDQGKFNLQYLELTSRFPNNNMRQKMNMVLRKELLDGYLCDTDSKEKNIMHSQSTIKMLYATKNILSFELTYDHYCAGPYPDSGTSFYIYDLNTGSQVNVEDEINNLNDYKKFLNIKFNADIPKNISQDCRLLYKQQNFSEMNYKYSATGNGLTVSQDYPHAARACEFNIDIPCSEFKTYLKPNSLLNDLCKDN